MKDLQCPKCQTFITVKYNTGAIYCPKCLELNGDTIIMLESPENQQVKNLGGGFFSIIKETK